MKITLLSAMIFFLCSCSSVYDPDFQNSPSAEKEKIKTKREEKNESWLKPQSFEPRARKQYN